MAATLSLLRKYKLITGKDLMAAVNEFQDISSNPEKFNDFTDVTEDLFIGLKLANDMADVNEARNMFNERKVSHDMLGYTFSMQELTQMMQSAVGFQM